MIFYNLVADNQIWFMTVYDKDEASDLSRDEKRALKRAIEWELGQGAARRKSRRK